MSARLLWFRLDLRLDDNPALLAAAKSGEPVIPVFVWAPEEEEPWPPGAASRWWLHQSLKSLDAALAGLGSRLVIRRGPSLEAIEQLIAETGADGVYWNRRYEPAVIRRDEIIKTTLHERGIAAESFNSALLFEPWTIRTYQVFTAFWKACLAQPEPASPCEAPRQLEAPVRWPDSMRVEDLDLEPRIDWAAGIRSAWTPGEAGAQARMERFVKEGLATYRTARDLPAETGTSRLSPHLHFGEISPGRVWHAVRGEADETYRRELGWREFAYHLLFHLPHTPNRALRPEFAKFPWREDRRQLWFWQRGRTGYPLVDAGMRELWATGWMHNRARMVTASFLTKHLRLHWQEGAYWFWDTLVDADLANNTLGWQWTAGCGADAAPYFRIFNPVRQSEQFDPEGEYIRRWVPELCELRGKQIHTPWTLAANERPAYVKPIVDHARAREEALEAFQRMRS
jgi:deoxyribodipyrimidine photo-lyase